ncbi:MAG: hypothetical protein M3Y84_09965 [Acidobacteriota bacterium]|nr:hypothetical protein [Acidobacteriota bacterium]
MVINVPDNLHGVPVCRNGLERGLTTFQHSKKTIHVDVISFHDLQTTTDVIDVEREGKLFLIRLLNEKDEFVRINKEMECVEVSERSKNSLTLQLKDCFARRHLFYFHDGKMVEVFNAIEAPMKARGFPGY